MNKVKYGLKNVHYAVATIAADGSATFGTPKRIPGAVNLSMDPSGEAVNFFADDSNYFSQTPNAGYSGTLEVALVPDDFKVDILGFIVDANGALVENADAVTKKFALMFEFQGDEKATRHVMYNITAARPSVAGNTKEETIEVQTETLNLTAGMIYVPALGVNVPKANLKKDQTGYSTFFDAVYQPAGQTFAANKSTVTIAAGSFEVVAFSGNSGAVTAASSSADVTAAVSGNQVSIQVDEDAAAGATITLTDADSNTATITVTLAE